MKIGLVGLGRMGSGIHDRLQQHGHEVIGYDRDRRLADTASLEDLVEALAAPRVVWLMVPAGESTESTLQRLSELLARGDLVVEGGNSYYRDSQRHADALAAQGIDFVDVGVSGGIWGPTEGFCLMAGGTQAAVQRIEPLLEALAADGGWAHVGPSGAGHFVKMVHNGIEYGMMQAYAEGFDLLRAYESLDLRQVAELWNHGSVVRSWLLELAEQALAQDPGLQSLRGYVDDSGEGRWIVQEAVERGVPLAVIAQSLFLRFNSREDDSFAMRLLAALRQQFGGHDVRHP